MKQNAQELDNFKKQMEDENAEITKDLFAHCADHDPNSRGKTLANGKPGGKGKNRKKEKEAGTAIVARVTDRLPRASDVFSQI